MAQISYPRISLTPHPAFWSHAMAWLDIGYPLQIHIDPQVFFRLDSSPLYSLPFVLAHEMTHSVRMQLGQLKYSTQEEANFEEAVANWSALLLTSDVRSWSFQSRYWYRLICHSDRYRSPGREAASLITSLGWCPFRAAEELLGASAQGKILVA